MSNIKEIDRNSNSSFIRFRIVDAVVRALASHQCGPGSNPGVDAICGLSLLLVLSFAPRGFSPAGYGGFPLSLKTKTSKFQFALERTDTFQGVLMNSLVLRGKTNYNLQFFFTIYGLLQLLIWCSLKYWNAKFLEFRLSQRFLHHFHSAKAIQKLA